MNGGRIRRHCRAREPPALNYSFPLPQGPSAMQLSCEPVLRRALLYPVNARALQQRFHCSTHARARSNHTRSPHGDSRPLHVWANRWYPGLQIHEERTQYIQNSLKFKNQKTLNISKGLYRTNKTFYANKEMHSTAVKHNTLFVISLLCQ